MNVVEASGLGKRDGSTWPLRECTLAVPAGPVAALAGPSGWSAAAPSDASRHAAAAVRREYNHRPGWRATR